MNAKNLSQNPQNGRPMSKGAIQQHSIDAADSKEDLAIETTLRDGTPVAIRPVTRSDAGLIEIGMDHLSAQSRYTRFLHPVAELSKQDIRRFTEVDQLNHIAWGALDLTHKEAYPIGVARCIRLEDEPVAAEIAVAVVDSHQKLGLGTILLAAVAYNAAQHCIERFDASVLSGNRGMLELFAELDATRHLASGGVVELTVPIHKDAAGYPNTSTGTAFRRIYQLLNGSLPGQAAGST